MRFVILTLLGAIAAFSQGAPAKSQPASPPVSVEFAVTDGFGKALPDVTIGIGKISGGTVSAPQAVHFPKTKSIRLPSGSYRLTVAAQGFFQTAITMTVADHDLFVPLVLQLAPVEGTTPTLSNLTGKVGSRYLHDPDLWIRLVGVYDGINQTVRVGDGGSFKVQKVLPGKYILLLVSGDEVVVTRQIDLRAFDNTVTLE